ncbi:MAG: hypothetical protein EOO97_00405 [Pedobacter sp.]|nr:MAG: hypothetical protein EOO97_00405 [Pedobacter sp.]
MQLIDGTYFIGELNIPNLDKEHVRQSLEVFMTKYQKRFLTLLLGEDVYKAFKAGLEESQVSEEWVKLRDKLVDEDTKQSPIANYVYWFFMYNNATQTTDNGEVIASAENSTVISPVTKMVRAWNEMCDFVHNTRQWFHDFYAEYDLNHDWYFFNLYCYNSYKQEFAHKNRLGL